MTKAEKQAVDAKVGRLETLVAYMEAGFHLIPAHLREDYDRALYNHPAHEMARLNAEAIDAA